MYRRMKVLLFSMFILFASNVTGEIIKYCPQEPPIPKIGVTNDFLLSVIKESKLIEEKFPIVKGKLNLPNDANNLTELKRALYENKNQKNNVLIFMSADWDLKGKVMANIVFNNPSVHSALSEYSRINIDITEYNFEHQEILKHFKLIETPSYVLYGKDGSIIKKAQGDCFEPTEFLEWLR